LAPLHRPPTGPVRLPRRIHRLSSACIMRLHRGQQVLHNPRCCVARGAPVKLIVYSVSRHWPTPRRKPESFFLVRRVDAGVSSTTTLPWNSRSTAVRGRGAVQSRRRLTRLTRARRPGRRPSGPATPWHPLWPFGAVEMAAGRMTLAPFFMSPVLDRRGKAADARPGSADLAVAHSRQLRIGHANRTRFPRHPIVGGYERHDHGLVLARAFLHRLFVRKAIRTSAGTWGACV